MKSVVEPLFLPIRRVDVIDSRSAHLVENCKNKRILHIGAADWPITATCLQSGKLLHSRISDAASECVGFDLSAEGINICREWRIENMKEGNAERLDEYFTRSEFDVVLAPEVIEHMTNPGLFLASAHKVLRDDGMLIVTVPNALFVIRNLLACARFENCHKDHVAYYSPKTLSRLCALHGYEIVYLGIVFPKAKRSIAKALYFPLRMLFRFNPLIGRTLVIHAKKYIKNTHVQHRAQILVSK